jgi:hypothetical protein
MRAVDARAARRVDVELSVDHEGVAGVRRHPGREVGVVVDLQAIALRVADQQVLVVPDPSGLVPDGGVERDLRPGAPGGERSLQAAIVRRGPLAAAAG